MMERKVFCCSRPSVFCFVLPRTEREVPAVARTNNCSGDDDSTNRRRLKGHGTEKSPTKGIELICIDIIQYFTLF